MAKTKEEERKTEVIKVAFFVKQEGITKGFYIGKSCLLNIPTPRQKGMPRYNVAGEDFIRLYIRDQLDSRIDPVKLAVRLYNRDKRNPYKPGFYEITCHVPLRTVA